MFILDSDAIGEVADTATSIAYRLPKTIIKFGYIPREEDLEPGDLILFEPKKWQLNHWLIKRVQSGCFPETHSRWSHAAVYTGDWQICSADTSRGVHEEDIFEHLLLSRLRVRRAKLPPVRRFQIALNAIRRRGNVYDWRGMLDFYRHFGTLHKVPLHQRVAATDASICSDLYAQSFFRAAHALIGRPVNTAFMPADLSATDKLDDVPVRWMRLR